MIKKYKNIVAFLIISLCLLVPFVVIKTLGADYEVFPAAIFPGGANKMFVGGSEIELNSMDFYGKDQDTGEYVELNKRSFLKKIYIHHMIYFITPDYLGAIHYGDKSVDNPYSKYATASDIEQTKEWIKKGLKEQNCKDSVFLVKFTELKLDKENRNLISNTVVNEKYFNLYR